MSRTCHIRERNCTNSPDLNFGRSFQPLGDKALADIAFNGAETPKFASESVDSVLQAAVTEERAVASANTAESPMTLEKFLSNPASSGLDMAAHEYADIFTLGSTELTPREHALADEIWHRSRNSFVDGAKVWGGYTGLGAVTAVLGSTPRVPEVFGPRVAQNILSRGGNAAFAAGGALLLNATTDQIISGLTGHALPTEEQSRGLGLLDTVTYAAAGLAATKFRPFYVMLAAAGVHTIGRSIEIYNAPEQ